MESLGLKLTRTKLVQLMHFPPNISFLYLHYFSCTPYRMSECIHQHLVLFVAKTRAGKFARLSWWLALIGARPQYNEREAAQFVYSPA